MSSVEFFEQHKVYGVPPEADQWPDDRKQRTDEESDGVKCCSDLSICLLSSDLCLLKPDT